MEWEKKMEEAVSSLLRERIKASTEDPNYTSTPSRFVKVLESLTASLEDAKKEASGHLVVFPTEADEMVVVDGIAFGLCPHHLLPVEYHYYIGYIPHRLALGLSKFHRIAQALAKATVLQEDYGKLLTDFFDTSLRPQGVGVVLKGRHSCMIVRGVKQREGIMVTSSLRGSFLKNDTVRMEFFNLVFNLLRGD